MQTGSPSAIRAACRLPAETGHRYALACRKFRPIAQLDLQSASSDSFGLWSWLCGLRRVGQQGDPWLPTGVLDGLD